MAGGKLARGGNSSYFRRLAERVPQDIRTRVTEFIDSVAFKEEVEAAVTASTESGKVAAHEHDSRYALIDHTHTGFARSNHTHSWPTRIGQLLDVGISPPLIAGHLLTLDQVGVWRNLAPRFSSDLFSIYSAETLTGAILFDLSAISELEERTVSAVDEDMTLMSTLNHDELTGGGLTDLHTHSHLLLYDVGFYTHDAIDDHIDDLHFFHDHGLLLGLADDDHAQYLLASAATDRATFAANWTDLTDAGATTLHKHDHGGMDGLADDDHTQYLLANGARALTGNWLNNAGNIGLENGYAFTAEMTGGTQRNVAIVASFGTTLAFGDTQGPTQLTGGGGGSSEVLVSGDTTVSDILTVGNTGSNGVLIDPVNGIYLYGSAIAWEDLRFPATRLQVNPATALPNFDYTNVGLLFDASSTETVFCIAQMPHGWAEGTDIEAHIHWMPTNTDTGNVLWRMEYKWTNIGDTEAGSFTTVNVLDAGDGTSGKHQIADFASISGTGKTISSILSIKVSRIGGDGTDTYNADALLKEFDIHYQINSLGSDDEYVKGP